MQPGSLSFLLPALLAACDSTPTEAATTKTAPAAKAATAEAVSPTTDMNFYSLKVRSLEDKDVDLAQYRGKVTLVVNVASECGFTPQYAGLQALHGELKGRGFAVLGFPSNDFGAQEPGTPAQIRTFCTEKYKVDFPLFAKVVTKAGAGQSEVYGLLGKAGGKLPGWNFCKYLVGKDGKVLQFFDSKVEPGSAALRAAITKAMQ